MEVPLSSVQCWRKCKNRRNIQPVWHFGGWFLPSLLVLRSFLHAFPPASIHGYVEKHLFIAILVAYQSHRRYNQQNRTVSGTHDLNNQGFYSVFPTSVYCSSISVSLLGWSWGICIRLTSRNISYALTILSIILFCCCIGQRWKSFTTRGIPSSPYSFYRKIDVLQPTPRNLG